jgi:hypothetical protein
MESSLVAESADVFFRPGLFNRNSRQSNRSHVDFRAEQRDVECRVQKLSPSRSGLYFRMISLRFNR